MKIYLFVLVLTSTSSWAFDTSVAGHGLGMKSFASPEGKKQLNLLHKNMFGVVVPNEVGAQRMNLPASRAAKPGKEVNMRALYQAGDPVPNVPPPPRSIDNSTLKAFPPVDTQGGQGSCAAWSATYYQFSHEFCLANHCTYDLTKADNTTKFWSNGPFSPAWTYNLVNGGNDGGSWPSNHYQVLIENGAAGIVQWPYMDNNHLRWDPNGDHWQNALNTRASQFGTLGSLDTEVGLLHLKSWLANGHLASFATNVHAWQFRDIKAPVFGMANPASNQAHQVEPGANYLNNGGGGHAMTVVGYDDDLWLDINENNRVDPGETGALKIVNSWGKNWGKDGFVWIAYDAIRPVSAVANVPVSRTQAAFWGNEVYGLVVPLSQTSDAFNHYKVSAQVHLTNVTARNSITLTFGNGPTIRGSTKTIRPYILQNKGGQNPFNPAAATPGTGVLAFDISELVTAGLPLNQEGKATFYAFMSSDDQTTAEVVLTANNTAQVGFPVVSFRAPAAAPGPVRLTPNQAALPITPNAAVMMCMGNKGTLYTDPASPKPVCMVSGTACPANFGVNANWNATRATECDSSGTTGCKSSDCTTGFHAFGPQAPETCNYRHYIACGPAHRTRTCTADIIQTGCQANIGN